MYVRMKIGNRNGEIRDVAFEAARELIASGRAEKVDFDDRDDQAQLRSMVTPQRSTPEVAAAPPVLAVAGKVKSRRSLFKRAR